MLTIANEKRLIDLNELGIGRCSPDAFPLNNRGYCAGWNGVIALLENAPVVNAVEVCFCKDCKYGEKIEDGLFLCHYEGMTWNAANHFCSYGEKKGGVSDG